MAIKTTGATAVDWSHDGTDWRPRVLIEAADTAAQRTALNMGGRLANAVTNGDFANGTTGWSGFWGTVSASGGVITLTSTNNTNNFPGVQQILSDISVGGHVWWVRASVKVTNNGGTNNPMNIYYSFKSTGLPDSSVAAVTNPAVGTEYTVSKTLTTSGTGQSPLNLLVRVQWIANVNGATFEVRNVMAVNLTETFGAGNEPSAAVMDSIVARHPNLITTPVSAAIPDAADVAAAGLAARMALRPSRARLERMNRLIRSLMSAGVWGKLDALYLLAAHSQQAAQLNWIGAAQDLTAVNAPLFSIDRGFTGNGTSAYLDTNTPGGSLELYTGNNASMGVYVRTPGTGVDISLGQPAYLNSDSSGNMMVKANVDGGAELSIPNGGTTGLFAWTRNASAVSGYRAGALRSEVASGPNTLSGSNLLILRDAVSSYSTRQLSAAFAGSNLTASDMAALNAAIVAYLASIGAA